MNGSNQQITKMLSEFPELYRELKTLAHTYLVRERHSHTLNTTALANEAYIRLTQQEKLNALDKRQFSIAASAIIRRVLVDHARGRNAKKRSLGESQRVPLTDIADGDAGVSIDLLDLNDALDRLAKESERAARLVELRFFGGLTVDQAAEALSISRRTAVNEWMMARAWLQRELRAFNKSE